MNITKPKQNKPKPKQNPKPQLQKISLTHHNRTLCSEAFTAGKRTSCRQYPAPVMGTMVRAAHWAPRPEPQVRTDRPTNCKTIHTAPRPLPTSLSAHRHFSLTLQLHSCRHLFFLHHNHHLIFTHTSSSILHRQSSTVFIIQSSESFVGPSTPRRLTTTTVTDREVYAPTRPRADLCVSTSSCSSLLLFDSFSTREVEEISLISPFSLAPPTRIHITHTPQLYTHTHTHTEPSWSVNVFCK